MAYNLDIHRRSSIRLKEYDYSLEGDYFITICTHRHECILGYIQDSAMQLNPFGRIAQACWEELPSHYPNVVLDEFCIMPNHVHGIIILTDQNPDVGARHASPLQNMPVLGTVIGSFKSASARLINHLRGTLGSPVWQRNYYEHIIRSEKSLEAIQEYINANPAQWAYDQDNPLNF